MKDKKMRSLLFVLHVDWDWIYQRPQILAHLLEKHFDVTVLSKRQVLSKQKLLKNVIQPKKMHHYNILPLSRKIKLMQILTSVLGRLTVLSEKLFPKDIIWICQPNILPELYNTKNSVVIYDCMDDYASMEPDLSRRELLLDYEEKLCNRADLIFVSSESLLNKLSAKNSGRLILIRNGCSEKIFCTPHNAESIDGKYTIGYVGTIAEWMDFDMLSKSLEAVEDISYRFVGPVPKDVPNHDKFIFAGRVSHDKIFDSIKDCACLIMPFIVNPIIEAVDPVKLYEYISFGKCIISVWYNEIERFSDFVYFYRDEEEYFELINHLKERSFPPKYSEAQQREFLHNNSWESRCNLILQSIDEVVKQ